MTKAQIKRVLSREFLKTSRLQLQKPFGFCCEEKNQDPEKRYDMRNPPFKSSMTNVIVNSGGPGVKFRVQNIDRLPYPIQRSRTLEIKGKAYLGRCKRCRGPLRWYLEDEIAFAREFILKQKRDNYNARMKKNLMIAKQKAKRRTQNHIKKDCYKKVLQKTALKRGYAK
ncbi:uncharacterized protein LOC109857500 [Pseudomyrmex gracilis]|uniref:uncharacterized protein LOC109857500 n=1 Tax=Pseudomyrmex gracilis TaxID=219809 RepID=UPI000994E82B|nr:uncharacterized protein LOC109857500 [Pseudomyrmex gracilis]